MYYPTGECLGDFVCPLEEVNSVVIKQCTPPALLIGAQRYSNDGVNVSSYDYCMKGSSCQHEDRDVYGCCTGVQA